MTPHLPVNDPATMTHPPTPRHASPAGDRAAVLLSGLCILHCLGLPLLAAVLPWLAWFAEHETLVHRSLLIAVVPISAWALSRGCARHGRWVILWLGVAAIVLLIGAATAPPLVPVSEATLTVAGGLTLAAAHLLNLYASRRHEPRVRHD